jgi:predicted transcriptional regulator
MSTMDVKTKYMLLEKLIQTDNDAILDQVKAILGDNDKDFWDDLDSESQASILRGQAQARKGETRPHAEVMKDIKSRFLK